MCDKTNAPLRLVLLFAYFDKQIRFKWGKRDSNANTVAQIGGLANNCNFFFLPGSCIFKCPLDPSEFPSPHYHSIEGQEIFVLDCGNQPPPGLNIFSLALVAATHLLVPEAIVPLTKCFFWSSRPTA
jgi:hypothetical protein